MSDGGINTEGSAASNREALLQRIPASRGVDNKAAQESARTFASTIDAIMSSAKTRLASHDSYNLDYSNGLHIQKRGTPGDNYELEFISGDGKLIKLSSNVEKDERNNAYIPGFPYVLDVGSVIDEQLGESAHDFVAKDPRLLSSYFHQLYVFNSEGKFRKLIQMPTEVAGERDDVYWRHHAGYVLQTLSPMEMRNFEAVVGYLDEIKQKMDVTN